MTTNAFLKRGLFWAALAATALHAASMTALGAEMPKEFQGKWCTESNTLEGDWDAYNAEDDLYCNHVNITATEVKSPELSVSCVVRKVTKLDVCPWGMIFRNREGSVRNVVGIRSDVISDKLIISYYAARSNC